MTTKTYQSILYQTYSTRYLVNGKMVSVTFKGNSFNPAKFGKFKTSDKALMAEMEKSAEFNTAYKLIKTETDEAPVAKPVEAKKTEVKK